MLLGIIGKENKSEEIANIWQLLDIFYNSDQINTGSYMKFVKKHLLKDKYLKAYVMRSQFKDHSPNDKKEHIIKIDYLNGK
jgi:hypothetical protein